MRVIELAVQSYASWFDVDRTTKSAIERASLDFMRKTVRRLPEPGGEVIIHAALIAPSWISGHGPEVRECLS
jgi:hypothetical protein